MKINIQSPAFLLVLIPVLFLASCNRNAEQADAFGQFEAAEVVVSAQAAGELLSLEIAEGQQLTAGTRVGMVDSLSLHIKRLEIAAGRKGVAANRRALRAQIQVLEEEKVNAVREVDRVERLFSANAATEKQRDDAAGALRVLESRILSVRAQNAALDSQLEKLTASEAQLQDKINRCIIINPINGTVLSKLTETYELTAPGKPLYTIANLENIELKAYVSGSQLSSVVLGAQVEVAVDGPDNTLVRHPAVISWIANEAEFTPKLIQTRNERVDLVYAVRARVQNDGSIKIGMPGELYLALDSENSDDPPKKNK